MVGQTTEVKKDMASIKQKREKAAAQLVKVAPQLGRFMRNSVEQRPGLSLMQYGVLKVLAVRPHGNTELAAAMSVSNPTMSGTIDNLVEAGLVERQRHPEDRRAVRLTLTGRGRRELEELQKEITRRITDLLRSLDGAETEAILVGMRALDTALTAHRDRICRSNQEEKHPPKDVARTPRREIVRSGS
jgi:DNA-binding MarR family transcriptional regulator